MMGELEIPPIMLEREALRDCRAAIIAEIAWRERVFPGRVSKGNMLQAEADRQLAVARAWREDLERVEACWFGTPWAPPTPPAHGMGWRERRAALLAELAPPRARLTRLVNKGLITPDEAAQRLGAFRALLAIYEEGWDWCAGNGRRGNAALAQRDPLEREAFAQFTQMRAERTATA